MSVHFLIQLVIYIVVLGLLFWLVHWMLAQLPIPEPFATAARVILAIVAFIIIAYLLLGLLPYQPRLGKLTMLLTFPA